jgi:sugar/nucleoside kinase (ribokinase family)
MSCTLVVGSIGIDTIETPHGKREEILGGAATHFSLSARNFVPVRLVGVVGRDFTPQYRDQLTRDRIDCTGLDIAEGLTFRWHGSYHGRMNQARTLSVQLNVLADFRPTIPEHFKETPFVFLGAGDPQTQLDVLHQISRPRFSLLDTRNLWITSKGNKLKEVLHLVDGVCINEEEAFELTGTGCIIDAASKLRRLGPWVVVLKRAEYGSVIVTDKITFFAPGYPVRRVIDPTGAGDAFAGGFLGYLAMRYELTAQELKNALIYGSVMGSFAVEDFGHLALSSLSQEQIQQRYEELLGMITL